MRKLRPYLFALLLLLPFTVPACSPKSIGPANPTGNFISRAQVHGESADAHVSAVIPHVSGDDRLHLETAHQDYQAQTSDLKNASKADVAKSEAYLTLKASDDTLKGRWYVTVGQWIDRFIWILAGSLVVGIVMRILAVTVLKSSATGSVLSFVSTGIFSVLSGGVSLIQTAFDNLWFRKVSPSLSPAPPSNIQPQPPG